MTSFSLFHRPTFVKKVSFIRSPTLQRALLASMFALSSRFMDPRHLQVATQLDVPVHNHFRRLAEESIDRALEECLDEPPTLCLLQALILTTFQQLTNGVRGRSWRALHTCVSIAYDLHLHLVDKNASKRSHSENESTLLEEKRRAWWTIWEFDVFASTIRKLPTAIDWKNNETWLPVNDELWFNNILAASCTLNPDPTLSWKELERSGNQSSKAWFIVINALMRCAHVVTSPQVYSSDQRSNDEQSCAAEVIPAVQFNLDVLSNSLYCISAALPDTLSYGGEFLHFSSDYSLHSDSAKYSLHTMLHLCRFTLHSQRVFSSTYRLLRATHSSSSKHPEDAVVVDNLSTVDRAAWNGYLAATTEIVNVIRNSSVKLVRCVNPFVSSTVWLAAAAQIVSRKVGLHYGNPRVTESNLDVLQMNLEAHISFWGVPSMLRQKLEDLKARLEAASIQLPHPKIPRSQGVHGQSPLNSSEMFPARPLHRVFHNDSNTVMQYPPHQQVLSSSKDTSQAPNVDAWNASQPFTFDETVPDLTPNNMWGYGLDELLSYSGFE